MKKPSWLDKQLKVWFVLVLLVGSVFVSSWATATFSQRDSALPTGSLSVTIVPNDVKLSKGQSESLFALSNGTAPLSYEWYANGTKFASGSYNVTFKLLEEKNYIVTVEVTDVYGRKGIGNTFILDPATINVYLDDLPSQATYTIKTDGTNYWAVRYDGHKAWESTNASYIIQSVNDISPIAKSIFISRGDYAISVNILPSSNTFWFGEGKATRLYLPNGQPTGTPEQNYRKYHQIFYIANAQNVTIKDMTIDGNWANNDWTVGNFDLVRIVDGSHNRIEYNYIINGRRVGLQIAATSGHEAFGNWVEHNYLSENKWNGVELYAMASTSKVYNNHILNNYVYGSNDIGINTFGEASTNLPYNNEIVGNTVNGASYVYGKGSSNGYYGIRFETGYNNRAERNIIYNVNKGIADSPAYSGSFNGTILNNLIFSNGTQTGGHYGIIIEFGKYEIRQNTIYYGWGVGGVGASYQHGVWIHSASNIVEQNVLIDVPASNSYAIKDDDTDNPINNVYRFNDLRLAKTSYLFSFGSGTGKIVQGNLGYVTEFSGTAEASDTDVISFGVTFGGTPQSVIITVNENDARYIAQVYTITTTGFSLYLWDDTAGTLETVDKTISWQAIYKP